MGDAHARGETTDAPTRVPGGTREEYAAASCDGGRARDELHRVRGRGQGGRGTAERAAERAIREDPPSHRAGR